MGSFVVDAFCGCVLDLVGCFVFCGVVAWWLFCAFASGCFAVCVVYCLWFAGIGVAGCLRGILIWILDCWVCVMFDLGFLVAGFWG